MVLNCKPFSRSKMMKKFLLAAAVPAMFFFAVGASAQSLQSSFFLDNYTYSYQLNPASMTEDMNGFFGLGIDNINIGANSNLGLGSVLFPMTIDGQKTLVTGLHPDVDADTFLNKLDDRNVIDLNANLNILSFGIARNSSLFTFELNLRSEIGTDVPKDAFALLKLGGTRDDRYTLKDISLNTTNYVEAVAGYSKSLNGNWRLGGRLHLIAGIADASVIVPKADVDVKGDFAVDATGSVNIYAGKYQLPSNADGYVDIDNISFDPHELGLGGFGAALDLGAEYRSDSWILSASVLDLGGVFWKDGMVAEANYSGIVDSKNVDADALLKIVDKADDKFIGLGPRVNAGVRYQILPSLSAGVLGTVRTGRYGWSEARAGLTYTPGHFFSIAATGGANTYGPCFGAAMNFNIAFLNLYLGTDAIMTSFSPQLIPINKMHTRLNAGLVINL